MRTAAAAATGIMAAAPSLSAAAPRAQAPATPGSMGARFRQLLSRAEPFFCLNAFDGPSAKLVQIAGFDSVFVGGSLTALEKGMPDWGLTTVSELLDFASRMADNLTIPVLGDADNGGGSSVTVYRTTQMFERAHIGGVMFEDRIRLERIGQRAAVVSISEMVDRIRAAVDARTDVAIVARTDALAAGLSLDECIERCVAYAEAGADGVLVPGVQPIENTRRTAAAVSAGLLAQIGPNMPVADARAAGVQGFLYTSMMQDMALAAYNQALTELKETGVVTNTYNAHRLPDGIMSQLESADEILERARQYDSAP